VLTDAAKAESVVLEEKEAGYDFLKVYARLSLPCYDALVASARKNGMRVMGHVPSAVGLAHVLESKQDSVEHLDGLVGSPQKDGSPYKGKVDFRNQASAWKHVDDAKIAEAAKTMAANGVWSCPTLVVLQSGCRKPRRRPCSARPEMSLSPPQERMFRQPARNYLTPCPTSRSGPSGFRRRPRPCGQILHEAARASSSARREPFVVAGSPRTRLENLVSSGLEVRGAARGTSGAARVHAEAWRGMGGPSRRAAGRTSCSSRRTRSRTCATPRDSRRHDPGAWCTEAELQARLEDLATVNGFGKEAGTTAPK
jgi:hypothetical protein